MVASANASLLFSQGFETDTNGWNTVNGDGVNIYGGVERVISGTDGITAFDGSYFGLFSQTDAGPFTRFGGYSSIYPGEYSAQAAIYLDMDWNLGAGFDYSVASNGSDGVHQRDFIFHVTKDTSTGDLLVGGSNNTNFDPVENLESGSHHIVASSGWYIFEHLFKNVGGVLSVDLNLKDALGNILFTETRSNASDLIPDAVGGNRYGWFTNIDLGEASLAVDAVSLATTAEVPEPSTLAILALGLVGFATRKKLMAK
ncbi:PEP-CTERM sorting domain-containing protein [Colwellia sp. MEBiC06753]